MHHLGPCIILIPPSHYCACLPAVHSFSGVLPLVIIIITIFLLFCVASSHWVIGLVLILIPILFTLVAALVVLMKASNPIWMGKRVAFCRVAVVEPKTMQPRKKNIC